MPDEKDQLEPEDDGGLQVEIIPESAEEKPRLNGRPPTGADMADDEISRYGKEVQGRIKKLRFAYHEERRLREQSQRDVQTTSEYARRLAQENAELKNNVRVSEQAVVQQALNRVDAEIEQAKSKSRQALESGVAEDIVSANANLARSISEKERLVLLKAAPREEAPAMPQPPPPPDARTQEWMARNSWYNKQGEEERTFFAQAVHKQLLDRGISAVNNPDLYWRTIDERLKAVFPDRQNNGNGEEPPEKEVTSSRPLAVAGGTRSSGGAANVNRTRTVRLSESQVRLARRLGLTPQQYAAQVELEEGGEKASA
jgi:hypothetical protein